MQFTEMYINKHKHWTLSFWEMNVEHGHICLPHMHQCTMVPDDRCLKTCKVYVYQIIICFSPESWNESSAQILSILINGQPNCRLNVLVIVFDRRPKRPKSNHRSWTWRQIKWIYEKKNKPVNLKWISQPSP